MISIRVSPILFPVMKNTQTYSIINKATNQEVAEITFPKDTSCANFYNICFYNPETDTFRDTTEVNGYIVKPVISWNEVEDQIWENCPEASDEDQTSTQSDYTSNGDMYIRVLCQNTFNY